MKIPNLKRIKVTSEQELQIWLAKHPEPKDSVMIVTHTKAKPDKYVSNEQVGDALSNQGWSAGPRFTLNDTLIGHVISKD